MTTQTFRGPETGAGVEAYLKVWLKPLPLPQEPNSGMDYYRLSEEWIGSRIHDVVSRWGKVPKIEFVMADVQYVIFNDALGLHAWYTLFGEMFFSFLKSSSYLM